MGSARRRESSALPSALLLLAVILPGRAAASGDGQGVAGGVTPLHQHAAFFDRNDDGVITLSETYHAFMALGFGVGLSSVGSAFVNAALGSKCRPENSTSSKFDIYLDYIHKGKHGSDTDSYDAEGRFVPEKFDEIFAKHAKTVPDALTSAEIDEMLLANRDPGDYLGWAGAASEWKMLYKIGKDKGLLRKEVIRSIYDGSLFHKLVPNWKPSGKLSAVREGSETKNEL